jgi:hypothetical protein
MNMQYGLEKSEKWFIELWNYTLQPYLNNMIKMRLVNENPAVNMSQQDPYEWILKNYAWPRNTAYTLNQRLFKLNYYNNYLANRECPSSSSHSSSDESVELRKKVESNDSNQHLVIKK